MVHPTARVGASFPGEELPEFRECSYDKSEHDPGALFTAPWFGHMGGRTLPSPEHCRQLAFKPPVVPACSLVDVALFCVDRT